MILRLFQIFLEFYTVIFAFFNLILTVLCISSFDSIKIYVEKSLIKIGINNAKAHIFFSYSLVFIVFAAFSAPAAKSIYSIFISNNCEDADFYEKIKSEDADAIRSHLDKCKSGVLASNLRSFYLTKRYREARQCIQSDGCKAVACSEAFEREFEIGVEVDTLRTLAYDNQKRLCTALPEPPKQTNTTVIAKQLAPLQESGSCKQPPGDFGVQLAAEGSAEAAQIKAATILARHGKLLEGCTMVVAQVVVNERLVFRLRTVGQSREGAIRICESLKAEGGSCFVARM